MTLVYRVAKLRFVERAPANASWRRIHAAADRAVPAAQAAFRGALNAFRRAVSVDDLAAMLQAGTDADMAVVAMPWALMERALEAKLLPVLRGVRDAGAEAAAVSLAAQLGAKRLPVAKAGSGVRPVPVRLPSGRRPWRLQPQGEGGEPRGDFLRDASGEVKTFNSREEALIWWKNLPPEPVLETAFNLRNPRAEQAIARRGAELVTQVTDETKAAIRTTVLRAQQRGVDVRGQAQQIATTLRQDIGLTAPQARAIANFEDALREEGLSEMLLRQRLADRRELMITQRSLVIARTETNGAANAGQHEIWQQAKEQELIPADTKRKWLTQRRANPGNPCPICAPMDGQIRGLEEDFVSPYNGATTRVPGIHVNCLCVAILVIEHV